MNKIEEKYGLKPSHAIALLVILVLNILWIAGNLISFKVAFSFNFVSPFIMFAIAVYYGVYGYKISHGNHMRFLILWFSAFTALKYIIGGVEYPTYIVVDIFMMVILSAYMAGRLDHYKQNIIISAVILAGEALVTYWYINLMASYGFKFTFLTFMAFTGSVTIWLAVAGVYITRFKLHKQAGLEDKK